MNEWHEWFNIKLRGNLNSRAFALEHYVHPFWKDSRHDLPFVRWNCWAKSCVPRRIVPLLIVHEQHDKTFHEPQEHACSSREHENHTENDKPERNSPPLSPPHLLLRSWSKSLDLSCRHDRYDNEQHPKVK